MTAINRRTVLLGSAAGVLSLGGLTACGSSRSSAVAATSPSVQRAEAARRGAGQRTVAARLSPRLATVDLGGKTVSTWAYGESVPGPLLRASSGEQLRVVVENALPVETSVHWHGIALRNDMDGVPGMTQRPIGAGAEFTYEFTVPDPGTYFYHPHDVLAGLQAASAGEPGGMDGSMQMGGMDHGSMGGGGMSSPLLGGAGDVDYPYYLVNGRVPAAPSTLRAGAGQRVRMRIVNAGSDTAFRVALGGHRMTVTHSDGFPVKPQQTDALLLGMGERYDVIVTLGDGVFPLVASAEGKDGQGLAMVRTSSGPPPSETVRPQELDRRVLTGADLRATDVVALADAPVDRTHDLVLTGAMAPYRWTINGATFEDADPLEVREGERVRLRFQNMSMMFHPMHVHGHTFGLAQGGARKDTVIVRPMQTLAVDLDADNPGQWATHCHNIYHAEAGMMTTVSYRA